MALAAGVGVAQAAVVAARTIPYKKGSKDTGARGHMALVGEEGPELVYMQPHSKVLPAKQTKQHRQAIDAMFDNRFDKYLYREPIAPRLVAQKQENERNTQRNFSRDLAESLVVNVAAPQQQKLSKVAITNLADLVDILNNNRISPFR